MDDLRDIEDIFELYAKTPEGISLWKIKGVQLTHENVLNSIFVLSTDIANHFEIRHNNLVNQNILKLQKEGYLPDHLLKVKQMVEIGSSAQRAKTIYALTRHQMYHLIMDFFGVEARAKKHSVVIRLESIEADVLKGAFDQARQKASTWDGVQLLSDLGFKPSLPNEMATKKDIATFLDVPPSTLTTFLSKHTDQITATKLTKEQILAAGKKANRLNAYSKDEVFKIVFWMNTEISNQLKKKIFGDIGVYSTPAIREEVEWKTILSKVFAGFGFHYQHPIGKYVVDFFVEKLGIVLECDTNNHRTYNATEEQARDDYMQQNYTVIRFNSKISLETLVNTILKIQPNEIIKLYIPPEEAKKSNKS